MTVGRFAAGCCTAWLLVAAGCALVPSRPPVDNPRQVWQQRVQAMRAVNAWEVRGRLAVKTDRRGDSFNMYWRRDHDHHRISLYGPLGAGGVRLTQDDQGATLVDSKDKVYHAASAEQLLYQVAGWRVPFESMQHWILGVAAPGSEYEMKLDDWGRLSRLTQNGWSITFPEYHQSNGLDLPRKILIKSLPGTEHMAGGAAGENESIQVKALIRQWDQLGN